MEIGEVDVHDRQGQPPRHKLSLSCWTTSGYLQYGGRREPASDENLTS